MPQLRFSVALTLALILTALSAPAQQSSSAGGWPTLRLSTPRTLSFSGAALFVF